MKRMVNSMVTGNFRNFARQLNEKWGGRDVLVETLEIVDRHDQDGWDDIFNLDHNEELLAVKIADKFKKKQSTAVW